MTKIRIKVTRMTKKPAEVQKVTNNDKNQEPGAKDDKK
jgi:hypothetical protein